MKKRFIAIVLIMSVILSVFFGCTSDEVESTTTTKNETTSTEPIKETTTETTTEKENRTEAETTLTQAPTTVLETTTDPITNTLFPGYKYNFEFDIDDNVFLDALAYSGYNLKKHRDDGLMWQYILSADKAHRGWLSHITYGYGSSGLETKNGLPDIENFENGGLVCASFASYVYFNYLPNVAKIDISPLAVPDTPRLAQSFYEAAQKWLRDGYTYNIDFNATSTPSGIAFSTDEEIPIGSIIVFRDYHEPEKTTADHITVYVGKKNGYHWVIQTGNVNGPEFCAVERFIFGPDPMWPLKIFATPNCIYDAAGEIAN